MPNLALFLSLRPSSGVARTAAPAGEDLRPSVAAALLSEAMLLPVDLPEGWRRISAAENAVSPFAGTQYPPLFIGELRAAYGDPRSPARVDQHVGVLPRWAERLPYELDGDGLRDAFSAPRDPRALQVPAPPERRNGISLRVRGPDVPDGAEAVILRRGVLVCGIVTTGTRATCFDGLAQQLAIATDERWSVLADVLR